MRKMVTLFLIDIESSYIHYVPGVDMRRDIQRLYICTETTLSIAQECPTQM